MKRLISATMFILLIFCMTACTAPAEGQKDIATAAPAAVETPAPAATMDAIGSATAEELRGMISQYKAEGNYEMLYAAASRLIKLDASDTDAYMVASDTLLEMARGDIEEINRLLAQGAGSAKDGKSLTEWAEQHQPDFKVTIPFTPDYDSPDKINAEGITAGNQTNAMKLNDGWLGGLLTWQGDWVYLSRMDEDYAIYKMHTDGSEYQRVGEVYGSCINAVGDWLYYINNADGNKPYKVRTDGSMVTKLNDDDCAFLSVSGEWMYYSNFSDGGCLYKAKTDGSEQAKLTDYIVIFPCVSNGWVYYCEKKPQNAGFCRVSVDGGKPQTIVSASLRNYCIEGDWIYYNDQDTIWRIHGDGSGKEVFFRNAETITAFNIAGGKLYISAGLKYERDGYVIGSRIIAIDMESMELVQKLDFNTEPVCTGPNGWIYFMDDNEGLAWYTMDKDGNIRKIG